MTVKRLIQLLLECPMSTPVKLTLGEELVAPLAFVVRDNLEWVTLSGWELENLKEGG